MLHLNSQYAVTEANFFTRGVSAAASDRCIPLPESAFDRLEQFLREHVQTNADGTSEMFMRINEVSGLGKVIAPDRYSGSITLCDGTQIEIFCGIRSRSAIMDMLSTFTDMPIKLLDHFELKKSDMNVFEMFVRMFINEVLFIMKNGLKSAYLPTQDNVNFLRGKTLHSEHVKKNFAHKERFFVEYDEYSPNRAENRLIKSTAKFLLKKTLNLQSKNLLQMIIEAFCNVEYSTNYKRDFKNIIKDRSMDFYNGAMAWCEIFLLGKSPFVISGKIVTQAAMFPMQRLIASYVCDRTEDHLKTNFCQYRVVNRYIHLLNRPPLGIKARPSIIMKRPSDGKKVIIGFHYKDLTGTSDPQQIAMNEACFLLAHRYAYSSSTSPVRIIVICPKYDGFNDKLRDSSAVMSDGAQSDLKLFDLREMRRGLWNILKDIPE